MNTCVMSLRPLLTFSILPVRGSTRQVDPRAVRVKRRITMRVKEGGNRVYRTTSYIENLLMDVDCWKIKVGHNICYR